MTAKYRPETTLVAQRHPRPYLIQWERTLRWQNRSREAIALSDIQEAFDFMFALFAGILQMRDWLTASRPDLNEAVSTLYRESSDLALVRDVANGAKHMTLKRYSIDGAATVAREYVAHGRQRFVVPRPGGSNREAMALATAAIAQLHRFMYANALLP